MESHHAQLHDLARVLIRCFVLTALLLLVWLLFFLVARRWAYDVHSRMFEITRREFDLINYCAMAFVKMLAFVLFLIPYVAVRLVLRRQ